MKIIIIIFVCLFCAGPIIEAKPERRNGMSVHLQPKGVSRIFDANEKMYIVSQSKDLKPMGERPAFNSPRRLAEYFLNQPREIQENGLWVVTTNPQAYSDDEMESTEILKDLCREKNIILFFCRGMYLPNGWIAADKFNLRDSDKIYSNMRKARKIENEAVGHDRRGNYNKAIELYTQALEITPNPSYVIHDRGMAYLRKAVFDKAIADFTKAIELNPDEKEFAAQCYNDRGNAYYDKGEYGNSWQDVQRALSMGYNVHPGFLAALKSKGYSK